MQRVPAELVRLLAELEDKVEIDEVLDAWAAAAGMQRRDRERVAEVLGDLRKLAVRATPEKKSLLLWICL